jgi:hypothetical protein
VEEIVGKQRGNIRSTEEDSEKLIEPLEIG